MQYVLIGLAILTLVLLGVRWLATTTPEKAYPVLVTSAILFVALAAFMALSGRIAAAVPFIMGALAAFGKFRQIQRMWRQATGKGEAPAAKRDSQISRDEAYEILGLKPGASRAEIKAAYKNLMQKLHPDKDGTEYLAQKINQARDTLIDKK